MSSEKPVYFPNINSLRFIAALLVIIGHTNQIKDIFGYPSYINSPFIAESGKLGVVLFFVLSGFLITFLLLKEKELTGTISIKKFYIRRILRIWPLYFLIILTSYLLLPNISFFTLPGETFDKAHVYSHFWPKLALYLFILPNLLTSMYGIIPYSNQAWSIGAEEQFYLVWPWFMKKIANKFSLMVAIIIGYGMVKFTLNHFASHDYSTITQNPVDILNRFWGSTPINCMAFGGIYALIGYEQNKWASAAKKILFNKVFQFFLFATTVLLLIRGVYIPHIHHEVFSILFGAIIINLAINKHTIANLEYPLLNYLGKISYGLYMYHTIIIVIVFKALVALQLCYDIILFPLAVVFSILVAGISYRYFEKPFIMKKVKYSEVISGDNLKDNKQ